jgi:hypothetical protein
MAEKKATTRTRNYATVVYMDSAPSNWLEILESLFVPTFISPYHNLDVNPTGEIKKPHYHVLMMYDSVKTREQAAENFSKFGGVGCEVVNSTRGYARYLCHLDNPDKHQYDIDEVRSLCGADYISTITLASDKYQIIGEMQDFCERYDISSFYLLCNYARKNRTDWYRSLCDNSSYYIKEYLKSRQWSIENNKNSIIDKETGDIIL